MMLFPKDPVFPKAEAQKHLAPIMDRLRRCVLDGFKLVKDVGDSSPILASGLDSLGTRPGFVNATIVEQVKREFSEDGPNLRIANVNRFVELQINDLIDLRFKHVDKSGRTSNYPTDTSLRYKNQLPLCGEAEELIAARLTLGWRWDVAATEIEDIRVIYAKGDDPLRSFSILEGDDEQVILTTTEPLPDARKSVFRSKKAKAKKTQKGA